MLPYYAWVIVDGKIYWEERRGRKLPNHYDLQLYVGKVGKKWEVVEGVSGTRITEGKLRRDAVNAFLDNQRKIRIMFVIKRCNDIIELIGLSPLFTDKPDYEIIPYKGEKKCNG